MSVFTVASTREPSSPYSIGLGEYKADFPPEDNSCWIIHGLGSCIGLILFDWKTRISGMAHIVLPDQLNRADALHQPAKYAETAVPFLLEEIVRLGAEKMRVRAYMAGGARMLNLNLADIGAKNIERTRQQLQKLGIIIAGEAVGGNQGRTLLWCPLRGEATVSRVGAEDIIL